MTSASGAGCNEPAWVTLSSADPQASATFYQAVLGWDLSDDGERVRASIAGRPVAAIGHAAGDAPPTARGWLLHIEVDNVATAVDTVTRAGGSTLVPAKADTVAVLTDSNGTRFRLHESGAELHGRGNSPGAFVWGELITDDTDASAAFYRDAFGWHLTDPEGPLGRREWRLNGHAVSGLLPRPPAMPAETPAYWDAYFAVPDLETAITTAVEQNATLLLPPTPIETGTIAVLLDPAGAIFTLSQPSEERHP